MSRTADPCVTVQTDGIPHGAESVVSKLRKSVADLTSCDEWLSANCPLDELHVCMGNLVH